MKDPAESTKEATAPKGSSWPVGPNSSRYVGVAILLFVLVFSVGAFLGKNRGVAGVTAGKALPVFAVPLALGTVVGEADLARHAYEGSNGKVPACLERGPGILNICALDEQSPVVRRSREKRCLASAEAIAGSEGGAVRALWRVNEDGERSVVNRTAPMG